MYKGVKRREDKYNVTERYIGKVRSEERREQRGV